MFPANSLICDCCGCTAKLVLNVVVGNDGKRIEWPKAAVKDGAIFFSVDCPHCGLREQCVVMPDNVD
jgi:hypothetical protein